MDWTDVSEFYKERILGYKPFPFEIAMLEFEYLMTSISELYPEALEDPMMLVHLKKPDVVKKLEGSTAITHLTFRRSKAAFEITYDILERLKLMPGMHAKLNSQKENLHKAQVIYCFSNWLEEVGWDVTTGLLHPVRYDLSAIRDDVTMFAIAIGSPITYAKAGDTEELMRIHFKKLVADSVFTLLEEQFKNPNLQPALLLPDDRRTRDFMKYYTPITRLGITLFWIMSMVEVKEI